MIHDQNRVADIRKRVTAKLETRSQVDAHVTDPTFREHIKLATNWISDIDTLLLADLEQNPRTPELESFWLAHTEHFLEIAEQQSARIEYLFKTYGPNITSIG